MRVAAGFEAVGERACKIANFVVQESFVRMELAKVLDYGMNTVAADSLQHS
jgi:hypothetical protein